ncbi:helix-turn-helix domain-containing protein [Ideonella sp. BN130291]|uniref:helix-turn-helix domain-containing protein n=1 Tax=Ideonella sp. BN130291 TaxID=3112940 RepID=UPI002E271703|nr:helix-turn-helix domain-containing protein [Ideonella sp. BN130291]
MEPYARVTRRLADSVAKLCRVASIRHVAQFFGLDWKTVKAVDFASLQRELRPVDLDELKVIGMEELAIQKGHRYATVIVEPTQTRAVGRPWPGASRRQAFL